MKLPVNNISSFARDVFKRSSRATTRRLINPRRDWTIGLLFGAIILITIMAWSAYMYVTNRAGEYEQLDTESSDVPTYRAAAVADALEVFTGRANRFSELQGNTQPVPQPIDEESSEIDTPATQTSSTTATSSTPLTEEIENETIEEIEEESVTPPARDNSSTLSE